MKNHIVYIINAVIVGGLLVLLGMGRIHWEHAAAGIGLLLVPSAVRK